MKKLIFLAAMLITFANVAVADVFTESDNRVHVTIMPTADIHCIPVQVSVDNVVDMTACQFYLTLPEGVDDFLYSEEDEDYVFEKSSRWRNKHTAFVHKGTIYYPDYMYVSITSATTQNFRDSSGPIITLFFDGSKVKDGKYDINVIEPLVIGTDGGTINTYHAPDTLENFTVEEGKVYPGDTIKSCNITFAVDGETISTEKYPVGANIIFPEMEKRQGYTFSGWEPEDAVASVDTTFNAKYDINKYKVTFMVDEEVYLTQMQDYGSELTAPEEPQKAGHTFTGWGEVSGVVTQDTIFNASFEVNDYIVTFMIDDEVVSSDTLAYGTPIVVPEVKEKLGYTFSGWGEVGETVEQDTTYVATYTINKYVVAFELDGETLRKDTLEYGSAVTIPEVEGRTGYTFSGWGDVAETVTQDTTYTARFIANTYVVTFVLDGDTLRTDTLAYGTTIVTPEVDEREGYTFSGWGDVAETVTEDVTYTAQFTINTYTVTYIIDGEVYQTVELAYGDEIVPPTPTKDGWHFSGWGEIDDTMPAHDVELTAKFFAVGDVNSDGIINAGDVVSIYNYISVGEASNILLEYADVNNDNAVNAADVAAIYNIIANGVGAK